MNKRKSQAREEIIANIKELETSHTKCPTGELIQRLDMESNKLKIIEVNQVAKGVMVARQKSFEYRDKSKKHLARIL